MEWEEDDWEMAAQTGAWRVGLAVWEAGAAVHRETEVALAAASLAKVAVEAFWEGLAVVVASAAAEILLAVGH